MTIRTLTAGCAIALLSHAAYAQYPGSATATEQLNIKGLAINMPLDQAVERIQSSLVKGLNSKTCERQRIAPTDDAYAMGDLLIRCEGNYRYFGEVLTDFSAIFAHNRLRFVGIGSFMSQSVTSDELPAVFRSLSDKFKVIPNFSAYSRYTRFKVYDFTSSFTDHEGSILESSGKMEYAPNGTLHHNVRVRLIPNDFLQSQQARIRNAEAELKLASRVVARFKAADL
jgi:hypothetical protein